MIVIIDYGLGNLSSIQNMLTYLGYDSVISSDKSVISDNSKFILPGVGAFDTGLRNLKELGIVNVLNKKIIHEKCPILGICLGAQIMLNKSDEGHEKGLSYIDGEVKSFSSFFNKNRLNFPIPNMGWRDVKFSSESIFKSEEVPPKFYFVHSYFFDIINTNEQWNFSNYGFDFCSGFKKNNILGVQFHPEKSHKFGMKLLNYFAQYV